MPAHGKHDALGRVYERCRVYNRKWKKLNPEKHRAHGRVNRALKKGLLVKQPCWCGEISVHAHHPNGYDNFLDVEWLCPTHHREKHEKK